MMDLLPATNGMKFGQQKPRNNHWSQACYLIGIGGVFSYSEGLAAERTGWREHASNKLAFRMNRPLILLVALFVAFSLFFGASAQAERRSSLAMADTVSLR